MFNTKEEKSEWIRKNCNGKIPEFTINDDLTVDCDYFNSKIGLNLKELPVKFRTVKGFFNLTRSGIENLNGFPESCRSLYIYNNNLTSLEGCPKDCRYIYCHSNSLLFEFKELPFNIEELDCYDCPINEIYYLFGENIRIFKEALDHSFHLGVNRIFKSGLEVALEEYNDLYGKDVELPKKLNNYVYV